MLKTPAERWNRNLGLALAGVATILILSWICPLYSYRPPKGDIASIKADRPSVPFSYWKNGTNAGFYHAPIAGGNVYVGNEGLFYEFSAGDDSAKSHDRKRFSYQEAMAGREKEAWSSAGPGEQKKLVVREFFDSSVSPVGKDKAQAVFSHFLKKDQEQWNSRQSAYSSLSMGVPWPGIELEVRARGQNVEKLFRVAPGASPGSIVLKLEGIKALAVDLQGELIIDTNLTPLRFTKPVAYQIIGNVRVAVPVEYEIRSGNSYGFRLGHYDVEYELVIDPLLAGTFLGGNLDERYAYDDLSGHIYTGHPSLVEDGSGNIFVIGQTRSPDFPTTVGVIDSSYNDGASILKNDVVITKLSPDLSTITASTYLGGTSEDNAASLLIDSDGDVYVVGFTRSRDFPVTSTGFDITYGGGAADAFIVKLSSDLSELKAATYLGGTGSDFLYGLTSAPGGSLFLVGDTSSSRFPVSPTAFKSLRSGTNDAFILKISSDLSTVETGTYLGGGDYDYGRMIGLNQLGQVVVLGNTTSSDFPTSLSAFQKVHQGETDAFVSVLASDLSSLAASTLIGGTDSDNANSFAINSSGRIVIAGATLSEDFPTVAVGYDKSANGGADGFIAQLESDLSALTAASYIGGAKWEDIYEIKLGTDDSVYFGGWTQSANLPVGSQSYDTTLSGASDAFLGQLSADLSTRVSLSYLGGSGSLDTILSLILHSGGDLLTYGVTDSADFPGMTGAQNTLSGGRDMFLAKITTDIISDAEAHHLVVRSAMGASSLATAAGGTDTVHIEAHDNQGRIVLGYSGEKEVVLLGPGVSAIGNTPTCRDRLGNDLELGLPTNLDFVGGVATCELHLFKAESTTLDAAIDSLTSTGSPGYDLDLTVSASTPSSLGSELSGSPSPSPAGGSVTVSLFVFDAYGNSLGAGASGQTVATSVAGADSATPVMSYIGGGEYTGSYISQNAGLDVITATLNGQSVKQDTDGTSDGVYFLQVTALALDHYEVRHYVTSPQQMNSSFSDDVDATLTVRVLAKDSLGNTVTGFNADRELVFSGPTSSPLGVAPTCAGISIGEPTLLSFQDGVANCELILYNAETTALDVTDGTLTSNGNALYDLDLVLTTSSTTHYEITGAHTQTAGSSQVVTITARDYWGNTLTSHVGDESLVFSGVTASATGNQPTATNKLGTPIAFGGATTVTFVAGVGTTNIVLYREGSFSIDVTDGTVDSFDEPTWDLDLIVSGVGVADASQSVLSTSANPAGTCGPLGISVRLFDAYGNALSSSSQTVVVTVVGANSGSPAVTNEGNGSYTAQYNPVAGGNDVITATLDGNSIGQDTDGIASDGTFNETIDGAGPNTVTWEGDVSTDWHTATNWVGSVLPTSCSDVLIDGAITFQPDLNLASGSATIRSLTLGPNVSSTLTLTNSTESKLLAILNDVTIGAHGVLTHQVNGTTEVHRLFVDIGGDLDISSGGAIDVTRKGYDYTSGYNGSGPGGGVGDSEKGYGGSHGGGGGGYWASGLDNSAATLYGSIREPSSIGSAGGGGYSLEGGGAMKVKVGGSLTNAGSIKANGYSAGARGGGGAGGSIWLICGSLNNTGTVSANGALWRNILDGSGGGGGGRVAVYYDTLVALGDISAFSGSDGMGDAGETAGTIFLKLTSAANGDLIISSPYGSSYYHTTVITEDLTVDNLRVIDEGGLDLEGSLTVLSPIIDVSTWAVTFIAVSYEGRLNAPNFIGFSDRVTFDRWGVFNGSSPTLTIGDGVDWWERGPLTTIGDTQPVKDLIVGNGGSIKFVNQSEDVATEFDSVTVKAGGDLRAYDSPNYRREWEVLNMKLGSLTVEANGYIYAPGWESYEVWGYGPGGGDGDGTSGSGGGHGGRGGRDGSLLPGASYGAIQTPFEMGSEGGNGDQYQGNGGGIIKLVVAGTTTIDGVLDAGCYGELANRAGGAGGSIWIDTNVLAGSGDIDATGGNAVNAGGGGGGRIAIYYNTNNFLGEIEAQGGNSTNSYDGGAGTIFLKSGVATYGDLILDNNHNNLAEVTPIETTLTIENLTVRNGSRLSILEPNTVTVLGATLTTSADSSIIINEGATFAAPNLASFDNLQVFNFGVYEHSGSTLTVNSGVSWYEDGTSPNIGASQGITSLVIDGSVWFGNQDADVDATFTDITVNSGGVLGARKVAQDEPVPSRAPPVAAYNFDEGAGANFTDLSGNGHTGTRGNATWDASGKNGSALSFNGTNAYASVPDAADFDLTSAMTLEAWVYPTAGGSWRTVILKERTGDECYGLYSSSDTGGPASNLVDTDTDYYVANSSNALPLNTWTHLATTLSGGKLTVYVNGLIAAEANVGNDIITSTRPLRIGGNTIWGEYFKGRIDDVRIYDRALSSAEIQLDMYTPVSSPPPPVTTQPTMLNVSATNINVAVGGLIDLNGAGYNYTTGQDGAGPAGGEGNGTEGAGGSYGGSGTNDGSQTSTAYGNYYGSIRQPIELGSAGGSCPSVCPGGGAVKLVVAGNLIVNGEVRANGLSSNSVGAGGSGGSVWLDAATLSGNGFISANGASSSIHGAGGGGRIAIYSDANSFSGIVRAYGGTDAFSERGGAGTVLIVPRTEADLPPGIMPAADPMSGILIIDNGVTSMNAYRTYLDESLTVDGIELINSSYLWLISSPVILTSTGSHFVTTGDSGIGINAGAWFRAPLVSEINNLGQFLVYGDLVELASDVRLENIGFYFDGEWATWEGLENLTIGNGATLTLGALLPTLAFELESLTIENGGLVTHDDNGNVPTSTINIRANSLTIDVGGMIDVSRRGYESGEGPGLPLGSGGAGYGGVGGAGNTGSPGISYGSMARPIDLGSGSNGNDGGGAVLLEVAGAVAIDGEISADGWEGVISGGSAGGSILITAETLGGSGMLSANGGDGIASAGGGSGGRIAVFVFSQTFIADGGSISVPGFIVDPIGGAGLNSGADGTLYFSYADHYEVTGLGTQVSGTSQVIDLQIIDNYGLPFYWNFTRPVVFSGPGQANINGTLLSPSWTDRDNNPVSLGQPTTLDFTDGAASASMVLYKVESTSVDVTDGTITSFADPTYDLDVTVTAQEATLELGSDIDAAPSVVEINNAVNVTVTVKDQWGNAKITGGDTVTLSVAGVNPQALVVVDNNDGTYSSSYVPANPGVDRITGTLNTKAITGDLDGLSDGTFYITVTAGVANHLEVTGPASVIAGTGYHITVRAVAASGAIDGGYSGDKQITLSGALAGPLGHVPTCRDIDGQDIPFGSPMTLEFVLGEATCQMRLYRTGATEVDASDGSINSAGNVNWDLNTTVNNLLAEGINGRISATPNPVERNFAVTIYVATFDTYGNALTSGGQAVTLQVTGVNTTTPLVTDLGDGTYSASYTPTSGGQDLITGTLAGLVISADTEGTSDGVFHETVTATVTPTHLEVSGANSQVAGSSQTITISARDDAGDTAFTYSGDKSITLSGPLAALSGTVPTCTDKFGADIALGSATTLTFTNGQATCSLKLYRAEVTSVDSTDGTLSSAGDPAWDLDVTVTAGAGAGSESILSATPNPAEVGATVTVTLQAKDSYGNSKTAAGDSVTFTVNGVNPAGALSISYIGSGQYQGTYAPSATGLDQISSTINTQAVTKDTDGTSDGTYDENIISYHMEVTGSATQTAGTSQVITISKRRHDGAIDTSYAGDHGVTLSGPLAAPDATAPTCTDKTATDITLGTATTLTFTNGQASCTLKLYRAEVTAVDATDGTYSTAANPAWDLDVTVSPAPGHSSESILSVSPNPQEVGGTVTITVQAIDTYQNPLTTGSDTVTIAVAGANPGASLLVTDLTNGQYQATYIPSATGLDSVTATINGAALIKDTDGTSDGTYNENIVSYHFEVTGSATQNAGSTQIVTIQLKRNDGTLRASYSGDHALTFAGPLASPDGTAPTCRDKSGVDIALGAATTLAFAGGQATCVLTLYRAETTALDAGDGTYDSTGNATWDLDVIVSEESGSASESILSAAPNPGIVGSTVTVTVQAIDTYGNPRTAGGDTVTLSVAGANPSASLSISYMGSGQYQGSYIPTTTGTDQITGSINSAALTKDTDGASDGTYHEDIISYHFEVTGVGFQEAGTPQVVTLILKKNDGSTEVNYLGDHAVTLGGPLAAPDGSVPTCSDKNATDINLGSSTTLTFAGGVATCTLKLYRQEVTAVDASDGTYSSAANPSWDLDITVDAAGVDLSESLLDVTPDPVEISNQVTASVTVRDQFQNLRTAGTDSITLAVAGANPQGSLTVSYQGGGVYSGTYTPTTQGQDVVSGTINAAAITQDTDGTSDGVYHLDVVAFHFEVTGSGTQVAGSSQIATVTVYRNDGSIDNTYVGDHAVTLSGPGVSPDGTAPTCTDKDGVPRNLGTATTLTFVAGQATCTLTLYRSETTALDATDGSYSSSANGAWDLDIVVSQASALGAESILSVSPDPQEVGQVVSISIQAVDTYGNLRTSGGDSVTIAVSGANPGASLPVADLGTGIYQASYTPTNTGEDQISGSINSGAILKDNDGVSDGTYHEDIISYHLVVTGSATQTAGASQVITLTVTRHDGVTLASYAGDHALTISGPLAALDGTVPTCQDKSGLDRQLGTATTLTFVGGVASCTLKLYRAEVTAVDATDGTYSSAANPAWDLDVTVSPAVGDGSESILSASPDPGEVGATVTLSVQIRDSYHNPTSSPGELVTLAVNGANSVPLVTMTHSGGALYQGTYTPINPGQDLITGLVNGSAISQDTDGTSDGTYHEDIVAYHLEVTGSGTQVAGTMQLLTITARYNDGSVNTAYAGNQIITLSGPQAGLDGTLPTCEDNLNVARALNTPTMLTFTNGVATCDLRLYRAEETSIDATDGTYSSAADTSWDLDVTVSAGAGSGSQSTLSASPNPGEIAQAITLEVIVLDSYRNPTAGGDSIVFAINGANSQSGLNGAHAGGAIFQASYTPTNPGLDLITASVNSQAVAHDTDGTSDGTYHEAINAFHIEVTGTATQEAGSAQIITLSVRDHSGALNSSYVGDHSITISGPGISTGGQVPTCQDRSGALRPLGTGSTLLFSAGQATCLLSLFHAETVSVDASDGTYSSLNDPSWDLDLVVTGKTGGAIDGTLGASPNPANRGSLVTVEVEASDEYGNDLAADTVVNAVVSGANDTALVLAKASPRIYRGNYSAQNAGEDLITATVSAQALTRDSDGVSDGVYHLTVQEDRASTHKIRGRVYWREPAGEPVKGVIVGDGSHTAQTNGHGNYELTDVADGTYTVSGLYEGYEVRVEAGLNPVNVAGGDVDDVDLVVWREAPLTLYAPWNGFLDNVVINEVFNTGSENLQVTINLYKMSGSQVGRGSETRFTVEPKDQIDIIINDLSGFEEDRYGVLVIEMSHGNYNGQVSYYKLAPTGSFRSTEELGEDFDYAFPNPFVAPVTGTSWVTFNTHQPSHKPEEAGYLVPNWLTIINGEEDTSQYFRIRKYDESGRRIAIPDNTGTVSQVCQARKNELRCRVSALGRIDIDGGHVYPGPERAGLIEIVPENSSGQYVASLVRYGVNSSPEVYSSRYSFGSQLQARQGQGREQVLAVSTAGGAENWVEIANTLASSVRAQVEVVGYNGELLYSKNIKMKTHAQVHLNMTEVLGEQSSGVLRVRGDKPGSLLAQSASYYLSAEEQVMGVNITQHQDTFGRKLYGSYNRYLYAYNWLKLINLANRKRTVMLTVHRGDSADTYSVVLSGYGGIQLPLHDYERFNIEGNTLGMLELEDTIAGSLDAQLLRIKPGVNGEYDFTMATKFR